MTYTLLFIAFIIVGVLWFRQRARADLLDERLQHAMAKHNIAARKAAAYKELLEQSYVGLQALAEKAAEAEWIRETGHVVQPGVWIGDQFVEVEAGEADDVEVGQPVGGSDGVPPHLYFPKVGETYDWKSEMP